MLIVLKNFLFLMYLLKNQKLKNVDLLAELSFYDQLGIIKTDQAFSGYARSYKVEIVEKKRFDCTIRSK